VIYVYTAPGNVQSVSIYHAFSGDFSRDHDPLGTDLNPRGVSPSWVHVVFASATDLDATTAFSEISKCAEGVFDLVDRNIPLANIRLLWDARGEFGANDRGEVGMNAEPYWANGNLAQGLTQAVTDAQAAYNQQFAPGQTKIGPLGSTHDKTKAAVRIAALNGRLNAARHDPDRITAVRDFLEGPHSFKDGSLKLCMVRALWARLRPGAHTAITPATAQREGRNLLTGIEQGTY
jgi:hypothetical protein